MAIEVSAWVANVVLGVESRWAVEETLALVETVWSEADTAIGADSASAATGVAWHASEEGDVLAVIVISEGGDWVGSSWGCWSGWALVDTLAVVGVLVVGTDVACVDSG